jgi:hypothetical protein
MMEDDLSQITINIIEHLGSMYDDFVYGKTSYTLFIEQSHDHVRRVQKDIPEHEIYLIQDAHYNLLAASFAHRFRKS